MMSRRRIKRNAVRAVSRALLATGLLLGAVCTWAGDEPKPKSTQTPAKPSKRENYIGIFTAPVSGALSAQLSDMLQPGQGLLVTRVLPGSPAERAGLKQYDILAAYEGKNLTSTAQLKKLVVDDKAGRTVGLGIVRAVKRRDVNVVLGEREVVRFTVRSGAASPRRVLPLILPERAETAKGKAGAPSVPGQSRPTPGEKASKRQHRTLSLSVSTSDNERYRVQVNYADSDGKSHQQQFEGTLDEIRGKLDGLPESIRDAVRRGLDRTDARKQKGRAFHFQLQPRIEDGNRTLRIIMSRPGERGETRTLELDVRIDGGQPIDAADLLKIDELTAELKQLAPAVRGKIEETLRQVRLPEIRLDVQNSQ